MNYKLFFSSGFAFLVLGTAALYFHYEHLIAGICFGMGIMAIVSALVLRWDFLKQPLFEEDHDETARGISLTPLSKWKELHPECSENEIKSLQLHDVYQQRKKLESKKSL